MESVLGMNIPFKSTLDALHRKLGLQIQASSFWKRTSVHQCELSVDVQGICVNAWQQGSFLTSATILVVGSVCDFVAYGLAECDMGPYVTSMSGQVISKKVLRWNTCNMVATSKNAVKKYWNKYDLKLLLTSS